MKHTLILPAILLAQAALMQPALAQATTPQKLIQQFSAEAGAAASAADGKLLFTSTHSGGKPETPSCTTCHTTDPTRMGKARTGKPIEPMAPRTNPSRFTDVKKITKWFRRNCTSVLGRECSPQEKANILAWLSSL